MPPPPQNPIRLSPSSTDGPSADQLSSNIVHASLYNCAPDWNIPEYRIAYHGVLLILQGQGWMQVNHTRYPLAANTMAFVRQNDTLAAGHDPQNPIACYSIGFILRTLDGHDLITRKNWPVMFNLTPSQTQEWVQLMVPLCADVKSRQTARQILSHAKLILALDHLDTLLAAAPAQTKVARPGPAHKPDPRVAELTAFIDANLAAHLTSAAMAKRAHVSPTHLAYLFHHHDLPTPMDFVRQRRIAYARTLLATSDDKIASIAASVGYSDPFHFSRVFKKLQGQSPEAYRLSCKHPFGS